MTFADIVVVGAGLAGTCAAELLGRQGHRVILVDPQPSCPPLFRAEKLEPDQVQILRKLGLFDLLLPHARRIHKIGGGYNGRFFETVPIEQYGLCYSDMVNALRSHSHSARRILGRVQDIANSGDLQSVTLADGEKLTARLVVLSCGVSGALQANLGFRKEKICKEPSLSFGFSVVRPDATPFPFDAITYHPAGCMERIDFLSLFWMGDAMRANLFAFRPVGDPQVRRFILQPNQELKRLFPKLANLTGELCVAGRVEAGQVDLFRMQGQVQPGVVLIGDAFQNACPSTGMGVSKVLTDVDVLCSEHAPQWLATPGMGREKIAAFYSDPRKCSIDASAIEKARYRRRAVIDPSLRWRIHRLRLRVAMQFRRQVASERSQSFPLHDIPLRRAQ